jgi:hypothetical protein
MNINRNSTLIILDWDDTLFPTSWVNKNNIKIIDNNKLTYKKFFEKIDISLQKLLQKLNSLGNVLIITNALLNWIEISSKIMPYTYIYLKNNNNIKIISARAEYSSYTDNILNWKKMAFQNELTKITRNKNINNIISIGDAEYEYRALINLYHDEPDNYRLIKSVKFIRYPNNYQIFEQINIINNAIYNICIYRNHLDLLIKNK